MRETDRQTNRKRDLVLKTPILFAWLMVTKEDKFTIQASLFKLMFSIK